jgi:hypothetical protein
MRERSSSSLAIFGTSILYWNFVSGYNSRSETLTRR